jgi:hypothetical protein
MRDKKGSKPALPLMLTCEARMTNTVEVTTWVLQAVPGVCCMADSRATFIDICLTVQTSVSWGAVTAEATY